MREKVQDFLKGHGVRFLDLEEGRLFLWLPVFLALGIGSYFSQNYEPSTFFVFAAWLVSLVFAVGIGRFFHRLTISVIIVSMASGFALAKMRTEFVRGPVLLKTTGFYVLEGQLDRVTRLPGNKKQLHLSQLVIQRLDHAQTPIRIRVTSRIKDQPLIVGSRIKLRAVLRPPPGPVRPRGFDFARQAWFARLGGVGFAVSRAQRVGTDQASGLWSRNERVRQLVSDKIAAATTGHGSDIALALIVGEKRSMDKEVLSSIRAAGLAHMLAISGMHMALVSGSMYWVLRALLALSQTLALSFDIRKMAATGAILGGGAYFILSGMSISTLRAFIMITIVFMAILFGRKALSLRNVSIAALLILIVQPESLLSVSFQMSFASVVALVAFYESGVFRRTRLRSSLLLVRVIDKVMLVFFGIFATTLIAGFAVAPIAVYHFHHITTYSVIGNMLAMPVLSLLVMPMAVAGMIAMPFGLHDLPLQVMGQGNAVIVDIARYVAGFDNARINVGTIDLFALLLTVFGGLWLCLWRSHYRYGGLLLILAGLTLSFFRPTPFLVVERDGKNVVLIDANKVMWPMAPRKDRYSLDRWSSSFGALAPARSSKQRAGEKRSGKWRCDQYGCTTLFEGLVIAYSMHIGALGEDCSQADILIATYPVQTSFKACERVKKIIDIKAVKKNGSYAIYLSKDSLEIMHARSIRGSRPWTSHN
ncbi:MAG: ComEC/Rec2 family competence protein [bacterium]|nr:ComEC/Rec2 family competence protein [bacterium]